MVMDTQGLLFWNVDTQFDFVDPHGKLYVRGAEKLKPIWQEITNWAKIKSVRVVNTCDYHDVNSIEISLNHDFIHTFPSHCIAETTGCEFIKETNPENSVIINWNADYDFLFENSIQKKNRNIIIRKDAFDVFSGNPHSEKILSILNPEKIVIYGVTTNVCVDFAVVGLSQRVKKVFVIEEAIKELPHLPLPFDKWKKLGVEMIRLEDLEKLLEIKKGS